MLSPLSYGQSNGVSDTNSSRNIGPQHQHGHHLRDRNSIPYPPYQARAGYSRNGVLPTPDPTVASCISDEDVARTLIALGDASNYSHGRTSNSTMDETFSGAADAASSTGATSDSDEYSDDDATLVKRRHLHEGDDEYEHDGLIKSEYEEYEGAPKTKKIKTKMHDGPSYLHRSKSSSHGKSSKSHKAKMLKPGQGTLTKSASAPQASMQARQGSNASLISPLAADEEDLSSKPRCQRCRKSKKGCDRQRPCGRCKDAGIGIEGCVSEDEGNGRKGRYGRHMGVAVKKQSMEDMSVEGESVMLPPVGVMGSPDNNKKRKR
jgi:hypothetical protein